MGEMGRWEDGGVWGVWGVWGERGERFLHYPPTPPACPMPNAQYQMPLTKFDIDYISQKILRCGKKF